MNNKGKPFQIHRHHIRYKTQYDIPQMCGIEAPICGHKLKLHWSPYRRSEFLALVKWD